MTARRSTKGHVTPLPLTPEAQQPSVSLEEQFCPAAIAGARDFHADWSSSAIVAAWEHYIDQPEQRTGRYGEAVAAFDRLLKKVDNHQPLEQDEVFDSTCWYVRASEERAFLAGFMAGFGTGKAVR